MNCFGGPPIHRYTKRDDRGNMRKTAPMHLLPMGLVQLCTSHLFLFTSLVANEISVNNVALQVAEWAIPQCNLCTITRHRGLAGIFIGGRLENTGTTDPCNFLFFLSSLNSVHEQLRFVEILGGGMVGGVEWIQDSIHELKLLSWWFEHTFCTVQISKLTLIGVRLEVLISITAIFYFSSIFLGIIFLSAGVPLYFSLIFIFHIENRQIWGRHPLLFFVWHCKLFRFTPSYPGRRFMLLTNVGFLICHQGTFHTFLHPLFYMVS